MAPLVGEPSTTTTASPSAASSRLRLGKVHGAGGAPGGSSLITTPFSTMSWYKAPMAPWIDDVRPAPEHGDGQTAHVQGRLVRPPVNAERHAADHGDAPRGERRGNLARGPRAVGGGSPSADDGDPRKSKQRFKLLLVPLDEQPDGGMGQVRQFLRVGGGSEGRKPQPGRLQAALRLPPHLPTASISQTAARPLPPRPLPTVAIAARSRSPPGSYVLRSLSSELPPEWQT